MKCPHCDYDMSVKERRTSYGYKHKPYALTQYWCKYDDIWVQLEVPEDEDK